jgi:hypothetical protein
LKKITSAVFIGLLGLGMLGGMGYYAFTLANDILDSRAIFARGVAAQDAEVEGTSRARRVVFHEYKLTLRYTDERGVAHTAKEEFDTILGEVDKDEPVEVHYDPTRPDRAASSWAVGLTTSRALWAAIAAAMSVLGGFVIFAGGRGVRDAFFERDAARDGREVRVRLAESSRDQYGNVTLTMTAEVTPGQIVNGRVTLNRKSPWRLGGDDALGLYCEQRRRVFLVESDGQPVVLSDAELANARERAGA